MDAGSVAAAKAAASALKISPTDMVDNLVAKTLYIGGGVTRKSLEPSDAAEARDSTIKGVYGKMFDWIVRRVNQSLKMDRKGQDNAGGGGSSGDGDDTSMMEGICVVGVLDIFGFEIFEHNSFEQLCINFANEKLQQYFNMSTFKNEQAIYESEKISDVPVIDFADNQDLIHMMEKSRSPPGLLVMLDEEVRLGQSGSDAKFLKKLGKVHKASSRVRLKTVQDKKSMKDSEFWVNHYAGDVKYDVDGFLSKNRDELFQNIQEVVATSQVSLVRDELFNLKIMTDAAESAAANRRNTRGSGGSRKTASLGGQFRLQLIDLMRKISSATPHYIRCIKPNPLKRAKLFDANNTLAQLRCSGVFEAVEIRKQGFPFRLHHKQFYNRYVPIVKAWVRGATPLPANAEEAAYLALSRSSSISDRVTELLQVFSSTNPQIMARPACQKGRTMVLYRAPQHRWLERYREEIVYSSSIFMQACARAFLARMLRAQLVYHRSTLRKAIAHRRSDSLYETLERARDAMCARLTDFAEAERVVKIVLQEEGVRAKLSRLQGVEVDGEHFEDLCQCIDLAIALGIDREPIIVTWKRRLESVRLKVETRRDLVLGVQTSDPDMLQRALDNAALIRESLDLPNFCTDEVKLANQRLQRLRLEHLDRLRNKTILFSGGFPMFVPSLSW